MYINDIVLKEGEEVTFDESKVNGTITTLDVPSFDVSTEYTFTTGQESTFYDFGRIKRKADVEAPKRQLKVYFTSAYYSSTDTGDLTTVNSYDNFDYATEIQEVNDQFTADIFCLLYTSDAADDTP